MSVEILNHNSSFKAERFLAALGVTASTAAVGAVWYFDPSKVSFLPVCPLYSMTGFACPGCGATRGFHALLHGDVITALDYNAMIPLFAVFMGVLFLSMVLVVVRGRGFSKTAYLPKALWGFLVVMLIFGVIRNFPMYPFNVLYP